MTEFIDNDCDFEKWVKVEDSETLEKVDIKYPDSCMSTEWLVEVKDIDEMVNSLSQILQDIFWQFMVDLMGVETG